MRKTISIVVFLSMLTFSIHADTSIGRCTFYGERPPHSMSIGCTIVYYHEMCSSILRGKVEYKQCRGDVWVIYHSADDAQHLQFHTTNGSVQTCNDY